MFIASPGCSPGIVPSELRLADQVWLASGESCGRWTRPSCPQNLQFFFWTRQAL